MKIVYLKLTFDDSECVDTTAETYDPAPDVESICEFGVDHYNLEDWHILKIEESK